eukprot:ANDGO_07013.mRNA.1 hypothetical protein
MEIEQILRDVDEKHRSPVSSIAVDPVRRDIFTGHKNALIKLWNLSDHANSAPRVRNGSGAQVKAHVTKHFVGHSGTVTALVHLPPPYSCLASCALDGRVLLWNYKGDILHMLDLGSSCTCMSFSSALNATQRKSDSDFLVVGSHHRVFFLSMKMNQIHDFALVTGHTKQTDLSTFMFVRSDRNGGHGNSGANSLANFSVRVVYVADHVHRDTVTSVCQFGDRIFSGSFDKSLGVFDAENPEVAPRHGHADHRSTLLLSSIDVDGSVPPKTKIQDQQSITAHSAAFSSMSRLHTMDDALMTASFAGDVKFWTAEGTERGQITYQDFLLSLSFFSSSPSLAASVGLISSGPSSKSPVSPANQRVQSTSWWITSMVVVPAARQVWFANGVSPFPLVLDYASGEFVTHQMPNHFFPPEFLGVQNASEGQGRPSSKAASRSVSPNSPDGILYMTELSASEIVAVSTLGRLYVYRFNPHSAAFLFRVPSTSSHSYFPSRSPKDDEDLSSENHQQWLENVTCLSNDRIPVQSAGSCCCVRKPQVVGKYEDRRSIFYTGASNGNLYRFAVRSTGIESSIVGKMESVIRLRRVPVRILLLRVPSSLFSPHSKRLSVMNSPANSTVPKFEDALFTLEERETVVRLWPCDRLETATASSTYTHRASDRVLDDSQKLGFRVVDGNEDFVVDFCHVESPTNGPLIVTVAQDRTIRFFNLKVLQLIKSIIHPSRVSGVGEALKLRKLVYSCNHVGKLAVLCSPCVVTIWDVNSFTLECALPLPVSLSSASTMLQMGFSCFSYSSVFKVWIAVADDANVHIWDCHTSTYLDCIPCISIFGTPFSPCTAIVVDESLGGSDPDVACVYIAVGCSDGTMRVGFLYRKQNEFHYGVVAVFAGHSDAVTSLDLASSLNSYVSTSLDGTSRVWKRPRFDIESILTQVERNQRVFDAIPLTQKVSAMLPQQGDRSVLSPSTQEGHGTFDFSTFPKDNFHNPSDSMDGSLADFADHRENVYLSRHARLKAEELKSAKQIFDLLDRRPTSSFGSQAKDTDVSRSRSAAGFFDITVPDLDVLSNGRRALESNQVGPSVLADFLVQQQLQAANFVQRKLGGLPSEPGEDGKSNSSRFLVPESRRVDLIPAPQKPLEIVDRHQREYESQSWMRDGNKRVELLLRNREDKRKRLGGTLATRLDTMFPSVKAPRSFGGVGGNSSERNPKGRNVRVASFVGSAD